MQNEPSKLAEFVQNRKENPDTINYNEVRILRGADRIKPEDLVKVSKRFDVRGSVSTMEVGDQLSIPFHIKTAKQTLSYASIAKKTSGFKFKREVSLKHKATVLTRIA